MWVRQGCVRVRRRTITEMTDWSRLHPDLGFGQNLDSDADAPLRSTADAFQKYVANQNLSAILQSHLQHHILCPLHRHLSAHPPREPEAGS